MVVPPAARVRSMTSSSSAAPVRSVRRKPSSSAARIAATSSRERDELRIGLAQTVDDEALQADEERLVEADAPAVRDRAAHDAAQDVAAALVAGQHAVGGEERHRAAVIGEHAQRPRLDRRRSS